MKTEVHVLDNGLKIIAYPAQHLQTVCVAVGVNYGSVDEVPELNGSAHYLEHMLFLKGTKNRTWKEISEDERNLCVNANAFTDSESTIYLMQCYRGLFEKIVDLLHDVVVNSTIPKKGFESERGPILNELRMNDDIPSTMLKNALPQLLYKRHPARMRIGGTEEAIRNMRREDLLDIYKRYYSPKNMLLAVYGGVSPAKAFETVESYFGNMNRAYTPLKRKLSNEKQKLGEVIIAKKGIKQARLLIGFKSGGLRMDGIDEYLQMRIMSEILWRWIYNKARVEKSLSYDAFVSYDAYGTFSNISAGFGTDPERVKEAKETLLKVFESLRDINKKEFEAVKTSMSMSYLALRDDPWNMTRTMLFGELKCNCAELAEEMPDLIKKVNLDDFRKCCDKYIDVENYSMLLLMPEGRRAKL